MAGPIDGNSGNRGYRGQIISPDKKAGKGTDASQKPSISNGTGAEKGASQQPIIGYFTSLYDIKPENSLFRLLGKKPPAANTAILTTYLNDLITDYTGSKTISAYFTEASEMMVKNSNTKFVEVVVNFPFKEINTKFQMKGGDAFLSRMSEIIRLYSDNKGVSVSIYRDGPNFILRLHNNLEPELVVDFMKGLKKHINSWTTLDLTTGTWKDAKGIKANIAGYEVEGKGLGVADLRKCSRHYIVKANMGIIEPTLELLDIRDVRRMEINIVDPLDPLPKPKGRMSDHWKFADDIVDSYIKNDVLSKGGEPGQKFLEITERTFAYEPESGLLNNTGFEIVGKRLMENAFHGKMPVSAAYFDGKKFGAFNKTYGQFGSQALDIVVQKRITAAAVEAFAGENIVFSRFGVGSEEFKAVGRCDLKTMAAAVEKFNKLIGQPLIVEVSVEMLNETEAGRKLLLEVRPNDHMTLKPTDKVQIDVMSMKRGPTKVSGISVDASYTELKEGRSFTEQMTDLSKKVASLKKVSTSAIGMIAAAEDVIVQSNPVNPKAGDVVILKNRMTGEFTVYDPTRIEEIKTYTDVKVAKMPVSAGNVDFIKKLLLNDPEAKLVSTKDVTSGLRDETYKLSNGKEVTISTVRTNGGVDIRTSDGRLFRVTTPATEAAKAVKLERMFKTQSEVYKWIEELKAKGMTDSEILTDAMTKLEKAGAEKYLKQLKQVQATGKVLYPLGVAAVLYSMHMILNSPEQERGRLFAEFSVGFGAFLAGAKVGSKAPGGPWAKFGGGMVMGVAFGMIGENRTKAFIDSSPSIKEALQSKDLKFTMDIMNVVDPINIIGMVWDAHAQQNAFEAQNKFVIQHGPEAWNGHLDSQILELKGKANRLETLLADPLQGYMSDKKVKDENAIDGKDFKKYYETLATEYSKLETKIALLSSKKFVLKREMFRDDATYQKVLQRIVDRAKGVPMGGIDG